MLVRISAGTPNILTEVFRGYPQLFQKNAGLFSVLRHDRFLSNYFHFIIISYLTINRDIESAVIFLRLQ
jgi:hypothetical protein